MEAGGVDRRGSRGRGVVCADMRGLRSVWIGPRRAAAVVGLLAACLGGPAATAAMAAPAPTIVGTARAGQTLTAIRSPPPISGSAATRWA